jgi:phytoene/squalene synthetase
LREYRRAAGNGRILFAVDELLQAGVENSDLAVPQTPPRLQAYLDGLQRQAELKFNQAANDIPAGARADLRHLLVLAALERKQLRAPGSSSAFSALKDMLLAWRTARRAT